jgi:hypothetical protein
MKSNQTVVASNRLGVASYIFNVASNALTFVSNRSVVASYIFAVDYNRSVVASNHSNVAFNDVAVANLICQNNF